MRSTTQFAYFLQSRIQWHFSVLFLFLKMISKNKFYWEFVKTCDRKLIYLFKKWIIESKHVIYKTDIKCSIFDVVLKIKRSTK